MSAPSHQVVAALRAGRARIENSWMHGEDRPSDCACTITALSTTKPHGQSFSTGMLPGGNEAQILLTKLLGFTEPTQVFDWNDAPERTKDEVLALYDKAIDYAGYLE